MTISPAAADGEVTHKAEQASRLGLFPLQEVLFVGTPGKRRDPLSGGIVSCLVEVAVCFISFVKSLVQEALRLTCPLSPTMPIAHEDRVRG
jgi:hypothetical protein